MDAKKTFMKHLRDHFAPVLRHAGFKGSGSNFQRVSGDVIHCINVQGNRFGNGCAVNLGIHLAFLPLSHTGECADIKNIKEIDCDFRRRLTPGNVGDYWWDYNGSRSDPESNARHLISTYEDYGEPCFARFATTDQIASMITVDDLRSNTAIHAFGTMTVPRAALTMARIHAHIGNASLANEFARIGIDRIGRAMALKALLQCIIDATEQTDEPDSA